MADSDNTLEGEIWKPVLGFEQGYLVSSMGRLKSLPRWVNSKNGSFALKTEKIFSGKPNARTGYVEAALTYGSAKRRTTIHRLVCEAFHGPPPFPSAQVAHNDGVRVNNQANNLRWTDAEGNASDRNTHGTAPIGMNAGNSRLTDDDVRKIRKKYQKKYGALASLAREYGVSSTQILHIVQRKQWAHI